MSSIDSAERILVISQDAEIPDFLHSILDEAGFRTDWRDSIPEAVSLLRTTQMDLILIDSLILGELVSESRDAVYRASGEDVPLLLITGEEFPWIGGIDFTTIFDDFIRKPLDAFELLIRLRVHLERRRVGRQLSEGRERFRLIMENIDEAFLIIDAEEGIIEYANPAFERIFGLLLAPLPLSIEELDTMLGEGIPISAVDIISKTRLSGGMAFQEAKILRPDGTIRWVWLRASPMNLNGKAIVSCIFEDITDRKVAEIKALEIIEAERSLAGTIQRYLLLNEEPLPVDGMVSKIITIPSRTIDGDFFDVYPFESFFDILVGDVMGKGLPAAFIGAGTKSNFLRALASLGPQRGDGTPPPLEDILSYVNKRMANHLIDLNSFFTVQYIRFALSTGFMEFIDCGHMPIFIWDGSQCWRYKGLNLPIGFVEEQEFRSLRIPLKPGNMVILYSDGVTEAKSPEGHLFGEERLMSSIRSLGDRAPSAFIDALMLEIDEFSCGNQPNDDVTVAVFQINQDAPIDEPLHRGIYSMVADFASLEEVRSAVEDLLQVYDEEDLDDAAKGLVVLAANEAAANVIEHGLGRDATRTFTLELEARKSWFSLVFTYQGESFDWSQERDHPAALLEERGYGLFIIREAMKSFAVAQSDRGMLSMILSGEIGG